MSHHFNVAGVQFSTVEDAADYALQICDPPRMIMEYEDELNKDGELEGFRLVNAYAWDRHAGEWFIVDQDKD